MKYIIDNIEWDTSNEEEEEIDTPENLGLPSSVEIDTDDMDWDLEDSNDENEVSDYVSEWLSDEYGYCHFGFSLQKDTKSKKEKNMEKYLKIEAKRGTLKKKERKIEKPIL